MGQETID